MTLKTNEEIRVDFYNKFCFTNEEGTLDAIILSATDIADYFLTLRAADHQAMIEEVRSITLKLKCSRCGIDLEDIDIGRWKKPICIKNGTEHDQHVVGISDLLSHLKGDNKTQ